MQEEEEDVDENPEEAAASQGDNKQLIELEKSKKTDIRSISADPDVTSKLPSNAQAKDYGRLNDRWHGHGPLSRWKINDVEDIECR